MLQFTRIASFYHWGDRQGLEQAIDIYLGVPEVDFNELRRWSEKEGYLDKFQHFLTLVKKKNKI